MEYLLHIAVLVLIYGLFALSLNLELGYTGLYNFGHVAFFGIGAYTSALLSLAGMPVALSGVCGMAAGALAGFLLSFPALRLAGDYFGIATLVFAEMFRLLCLGERWLTKGPMGLPGIPRPEWMPPGVQSLPVFLASMAALVALMLWLLRRVTRSPFGRALKVVREDPNVAQALGKNVTALQRKSLCIGSALAGLAGVAWAHYITYISPADFTLNETILVLLCVILGGKGSEWGPLVGTAVVICLGEVLRFLPLPENWIRLVAPLQGMAYGLLLILLMLKRPQGLIPEQGC